MPKMKLSENLYYWLSNIITLGLWYLLKVTIKKALVEYEEYENKK